MGISVEALPEIENKFVIFPRISEAEPVIDCTDKPYTYWSPDQATCLEEFVLVVHCVTDKKLRDPAELLEIMDRKGIPISLDCLKVLAAATRSMNQSPVNESLLVSNTLLPA